MAETMSVKITIEPLITCGIVWDDARPIALKKSLESVTGALGQVECVRMRRRC
jgi:hypothetical protein